MHYFDPNYHSKMDSQSNRSNAKVKNENCFRCVADFWWLLQPYQNHQKVLFPSLRRERKDPHAFYQIQMAINHKISYDVVEFYPGCKILSNNHPHLTRLSQKSLL